MYGQMGCQLFFLLSGFTLCLSYFKKRPTVLSFYKQRFISIAPGYWMMIIVFFFLNYLLVDILNVGTPINTKRDFFNVLINFLLLNGIFPSANNSVVPGGWFIGTIVILYLLFPLLTKYLTNVKRSYKYILLSLAISISIQIILALKIGNFGLSNRNTFVYFSFLNQISCMMQGFVLYYQYIDNKFKNREYIYMLSF